MKEGVIMDKISFEDFKKIMSYDITKNETCIEIEFCVDNCETYQTSWLGKMSDRETNKVIYWFGSTEDGLQAYDFDSFEKFINTKVFYGKSLKEIWNLVSLISIDASDSKERLQFYLGKA